MAQISLTFPDGNKRDYAAGVTPAEVAASIAPGLAKKAISATVNGAHFDLQWPITADATIAIHTMADDAQALELIRHDCAHIMARAVQEIWPDVKVTIGPVRDYGWFYDFDRAEPFTPEDLGAIEAQDEADHQRPRPGQDRGLGPRAAPSNTTRGRHEPFKVELIDRIPEGEDLRMYWHGHLAGSVPWPASAAHRAGARRRLQADPCRRGLLAGRCHAARCCSASTAWRSRTATI